MICPHCKNINNCDCKNCNPDGKTENVAIINELRTSYICSFCKKEFNPQDSLDLEWDMMIEGISKKISPEMCLKWLESSRGERLILEKQFSESDYGFAIRSHFNIPHYKIDKSVLLGLKRGSKIDKILD